MPPPILLLAGDATGPVGPGDASPGLDPVAVHGRPASGLGHYLRDIVYGGLDGAITTFAVVAGADGAGFAPRVGIVLGCANLAADGLSMAAANYLALKSELEQTGGSVTEEQPWRHGGATFLAFIVAGAVPLASYLLPPPGRLLWALAMVTATLMGIGAMRARFIRRSPLRAGLEMTAVGIAAGAAAFAVGALIQRLL